MGWISKTSYPGLGEEIMINSKKEKKPNEEANVEVSAHIIIRDKKTGKEILNQRG